MISNKLKEIIFYVIMIACILGLLLMYATIGNKAIDKCVEAGNSKTYCEAGLR